MQPRRSLFALLVFCAAAFAEDAPQTDTPPAAPPDNAQVVAEADAPATQPAPAPTTEPSPIPSSRQSPSTKPTPSAPRRLLTLAEFFIKKKAYPAARQRLETIIKDYPDDPAAKDAQALLDSITKGTPPTVEWKTAMQGRRNSE